MNIESIKEFLASLRDARRWLTLRRLSEEERVALRGKWSQIMPELARRTGHMMVEAPGLFSWAPASGRDLLKAEEYAQMLSEVRSELEVLITEISDTLLYQRSQLFEQTHGVVVGVQRILFSPLTSEEMREQLQEISSPVRALLAERKAAIDATRASTLRRNRVNQEELSALRETLDQVRAENEVLRSALGQSSAPGTAPVTAPRRARRTRR